MTKSILPILILIFVSSCSEDNKLSKTSGKILSETTVENGDQTWTEVYSYNIDGELIEIKEIKTSGRRFEFVYHQNEIIEVKTFNDDQNELIFRDSISYDSSNLIDMIYNFSKNSGENLPLTILNSYKYDTNQNVIEKTIYSISSQEVFSIERYFWTDGEISRSEYRNRDEELLYEYFYTYDDKNSYTRPEFVNVNDPINWSRHNVLEMDWIDHYGNLDLVCKPCTNSYTYNEDDFPVVIDYDYGRKVTLQYLE